MNPILAIDQSTSATKALLFRPDGCLVDKESLDHAQLYPQPGWVEHDAEVIWQNTINVCDQLLARNPDAMAELKFVSVTNQRETMVLFERDGGRPVCHAIVWLCTRTEALCKQMKAEAWAPEVKARTGLEIDSYFSAPKLRWMLAHDAAIAERVRSGEVRFGTMDTYLIYRMTDGRVYATDPTNASRTMLYHLCTRTWDPMLCETFGIDASLLATILPCDAHFGETTLAGLLPTPLPIIGVMGDSQAALFAQRCFTKGSTKVTLGTGSSLLYNIGDQPRFSEHGVVTTLASVIGDRPTYSFEGIIRFASATMDWLENQLGLFDSIQEADDMAATLEDSGGVILVPAFTGLGAPYWNTRVRAAILGLTPHSTRAHIIRAGFESIGFQVRDVLEMMEHEVGSRCECLHVDGGPTRSAFLMQLLADILQRTIAVSSIPECSALGAVMAGLLGSGSVASLEGLTSLPRNQIDYHPRQSHAKMQPLYEQWKANVDHLNAR